MFLPRFQPYHQNLHIFYLNFPRFIEFFKNDLLTGYIHIGTLKKEYFVFLEQGQLINALGLDTETNSCNTVGIEEIINKVSDKDGIVSVYFLPENTTPFWANVYNAKVLYPNLSTEFTNLIKLINKLKKETITGWIEIQTGNNEKSFIYFVEGEIIGTCTSWHNWQFNEGETNLTEIAEKASEAVFNVYTLKLARSSVNMNLDIIKGFFQQLLSALEKGIGKERFRIMLRQKGIEKAEQYPFLDPFADEFDYQNGKIILKGDISERDLLEGFREVCKEIITENPKAINKIKRELSQLRQKYDVFIENAMLEELLKV